MKYKLYLTDSIESLENEELLIETEDIQEAFKALGARIGKTAYWRFSLAPDATYIDYGSWSRFGAVVPALSMKDLMNHHMEG